MKVRSESSKKDKIVGLFGGTFDPVHFGHLNLAIELKERCSLDEVWVIPTALSPFRTGLQQASALHRFKMAEIAFSAMVGFQVLDYEIQKKEPCYTIDTLAYLLAQFPTYQFLLLVGEDSAASFSEWRRFEEIKKMVPIVVGRRRGESLPSLDSAFPLLKEEIPVMEISATRVRDRIKKRLDCRHLVPAKVLDYIGENQLYFSP